MLEIADEVCAWCTCLQSEHKQNQWDHCRKMIARAKARPRIGKGWAARCKHCGHKRSEHQGVISEMQENGKFMPIKFNVCWHTIYRKDREFWDDGDSCHCEIFI